MSTLCVIANKFPYGTIETYMETESKYYRAFDEVIICSLTVGDKDKKNRREVDEKITVIPIKLASRIKYLFGSLYSFADRNFYREIRYLFKHKRFSLRRLFRLFVYISRAHVDSREVNRQAGRYLKDKDVVFYSYRFEYQPYVSVLLKKKLKSENAVIVSRAHRYDLYEDQNKDGYIPLRQTLVRELRGIYPCSDYGRDYLRSMFPEYSDKICSKFLGTIDRGTQEPYKQDDNKLFIVSCSHVVPVKRIDKILDVLKRLNGYQIYWTHFGAGPLMEWLQTEAGKLPENVTVNLMGSVPNGDIIEHYKKNYYDFFINMSDSEGIPVSIMEAMSFGIPSVATKAGGTGEIVQDNVNGLLFDIETGTEEIANRIAENKSRFCEMRDASRKMWEEKYMAERNYSSFVNELLDAVAGTEE